MPQTVADTFTTTDGRVIHLDPAHPSSVRVASASGYSDQNTPSAPPPSPETHLRRVRSRVDLALTTLALHGVQLEQGRLTGAPRVLVIGASDAAEVALLAHLGAAHITGTDFGSPFISSPAFTDRSATLDAAAQLFPGTTPSPVDLRLDDITNSLLPDAAFDLVLSWQTLEHIPDPHAALRTLHRVMAPGALAYHEHHSFFAIDGGHSLCTLDAPWLHTRLEPDDFALYARVRRPDTAEEAISFFTNSLNRMTQQGLADAVTDADLTLELLLPRLRPEDLAILTPDILEQTRALHPRVGITDLTCRIVRSVMRRPG